MTDCPHTEIVLIPTAARRLRCRHCHLTIRAEDLGDGYCPECFEASGKRRFDFDEIAPEGNAAPRYRCEQCGAILHPAP
ncbi:MAG: hypothetical protein ABIL58_27295 [Pseudomonadota bacterium]